MGMYQTRKEAMGLPGRSKIGVAIGTYGDRSIWGPLARTAMKSVESQTQECDVLWIHGASLHEARNEAAQILINDGVEWLIFLDADDQLDDMYVMAMAYAASTLNLHTSDVFQPSVIPVVNGVEGPVFFNKASSLLRQNYLPVGCMHSAYLFNLIGGFDDWPVLSDWAYWCKAWVNGARFREAPNAWYLAHVDEERSRKKESQMIEAETHAKIRSMYTFLAKKKGLI